MDPDPAALCGTVSLGHRPVQGGTHPAHASLPGENILQQPAGWCPNSTAESNLQQPAGWCPNSTASTCQFMPHMADAPGACSRTRSNAHRGTRTKIQDHAVGNCQTSIFSRSLGHKNYPTSHLGTRGSACPPAIEFMQLISSETAREGGEHNQKDGDDDAPTSNSNSAILHGAATSNGAAILHGAATVPSQPRRIFRPQSDADARCDAVEDDILRGKTLSRIDPPSWEDAIRGSTFPNRRRDVALPANRMSFIPI